MSRHVMVSVEEARRRKAIQDALVQERHLRGLPPHQFALCAAYYLGEINALHPFREGNERTQRVFFNDLARQAVYVLIGCTSLLTRWWMQRFSV